MAEVYLAKCFGVSGFDRLVALKRILPTIAEDDEFIAMFIDEAKIAGQLSHNNVAQIFDLGKINASYFIAMEYISGHDLRVLWDRTKKGGMPLDLCCYVVRKICEGLDYAHRRRDSRGRPLGIIHRDVSPQNILLSYEGDTKVIDFGIAKAANRMVKTQTGILKGKFAYMAPEQAKGEPTDHRADVFAIGVILYELITGERAFKADTDFALLEKVRRVDVIPPRKIRNEIPRDLERIVYKALAQKASDRYAWASDMATDLDAFMSEHDLSYNKRELGAFVKNAFVEEHNEENKRLEVYKSFQLEGEDESVYERDAGTAVHHQESSATNELHNAGTEVAADDVLSYEESEESSYDDCSDEAYSEEGNAFEDGATEAFVGPFSPEESEEPRETSTTPPIKLHSDDISVEEFSETGSAIGQTRVNISRPKFPAGIQPEDATQVDDSPILDSDSELSSQKSAFTEEASLVDPLSEEHLSKELPQALPPPPLAEKEPFLSPTFSEESRQLLDEKLSGADSGHASNSLGEMLKNAPETERASRPSTHPTLEPQQTSFKKERTNFDAPIPMTSAPIARQQDNKTLFGIIAAAALVFGGIFGVLFASLVTSSPSPNFIVDTRPAGAKVTAKEEIICEKTPCAFYIDTPQEVFIEKTGASTEKVIRKLVPSERTQLLRLILDEVKLIQKVSSSPTGAKVYLNGKALGKTPLNLPEMTEGTKVQLTVKKAGFVPQTLTREVQASPKIWKPIHLPAEKTQWVLTAIPKDAVVTPPNSAWGFPGKAELKVAYEQRAGVVIERPGCKRKIVIVEGNGKTSAEQQVELECPPLDAKLTLKAPKKASVRINGILFSAKAVRNYPLPEGVYTIVVRFRGREESQQVDLKKDKPATLTFFH